VEGVGDAMGARNAPLRRFAVTVQRDAAEGLGVSPNFLNLPPRVGVRGLKKRIDTLEGG
jgi:hypothetical protein